MNKKILTAAIGAALVAGPLAAQADLKISGRVSGSLASFDGTIAFADYGNTRLQFDASDDSGWFARLAKDMRLGRMRTTGSAVVTTTTVPVVGNDQSLRTDRDQYVGIKTGFGSFSFGRIAGAVKNIEADPYIATFLELRNNATLGGSNGSSSFRNNIVQFANKFGDASVKVQYVPVDSLVGSNGELGASIVTKVAGARVFAGYNNQGNNGSTFYKLGGSMKFGNINAKLQYEDLTGAGSNYSLGAEMGLGDGASADVTYADKGTDGVNAYYRVAYMKKASKKARFWIGYTQNGAQVANAATYGAGARVDF